MRPIALLVLLAATIAGACAIAFQCDDAYITFRYVSNAHDGLGLVWNPPPFLPVEGYTGFLWAILLWGTWSLLGVEPPDAANWWSITFGVCQFVVIAYAAFRLRRRDGSPVGDTVALATIACIVAQRTFLQWMTSGLETALFNFAFVSWVLLAFRARERRSVKWLLLWAAAAAVAALTRPDGLLLAAVTGAAAWPSLADRRVKTAALGLLPLLAVVVHVAWRKSFYGEWLPNTAFAKIVAPWPEVGIPYFECFLFEHGLWLWFPVALVWFVVDAVGCRGRFVATWMRRAPAVAAVSAIAFHTGYYILKVGGDHFEYRVLSQLVPLAWLSLAAMGAQLFRRTGAVLATLGIPFLFSTVGWVHFAISRDLPMNPTGGMTPLATKLPAMLQPLWRWHDAQQLILHLHFVCLRANQHRLALETFFQRYPERGKYATDDDVPVLIEGVVGVCGWTLRDVAIVDELGLNDWVVARTRGLDWQTAPEFANIQRVMHGADVDGNGLWTRDELRGWVKTLFPAATDDVSRAEPVLDAGFLLFAREHDDAMTRPEIDAFVQALFGRGAMAHERHPPPGYTEAFEPNVAVTPTGVTITPRQHPLKPRLREIETEWRAKYERGELKVR